MNKYILLINTYKGYILILSFRIQNKLNHYRIDKQSKMDKRLNKRIENYTTTFKDAIKKKIIELAIEDKQKVNHLIEFVYNYERLSFTKEDVSKRKRIKNSIPGLNRCNAKRANGEQCTRKQKEGYEYCGTHVKGIPHGIIFVDKNQEKEVIKSEVFAEDIYGIVYYIDKHNNVYKTEDILNEKENPEIIARYEIMNSRYTIPEFGLV